MITTELAPQCYVCRRPVDVFWMFDDPFTFTRKFTAECHGEKETVELTEYDLARLSADPALAITLGIAFAPKSLLYEWQTGAPAPTHLDEEIISIREVKPLLLMDRQEVTP